MTANPEQLLGTERPMISDDDHYRRLERMYLSAPINAIFRPTIHVSEGRTEIVMPMRRDFHHAANAVHGAVYFKALDDASFFAANSLVRDVFVLTVTYTVYLTRPIADGEMRATGNVVHRSKNLILAEAEVVDSAGRQIARGSGSFMQSRTPLTAEIGYA